MARRPADHPRAADVPGRCLGPGGTLRAGRAVSRTAGRSPVALNSVGACVRCVRSAYEKRGPHPGTTRGGLDCRRSSGSHHVFVHPRCPHIITVPHPRKDLGSGLVQAIRKLAGLT
ncbi:type II toxin-antitoxin system HicA family toxin [Stenotrophomonas sp.]|uniref:type II toxin-antitoxin system HicA family toxin n=1 Tax=Stenotrophomonas sp. TaxID=69392 RepID=UPI0028AF29C1|nr:type II toxin-antitoxin system HicA family toxin [Stenotrophomonas sp.]